MPRGNKWHGPAPVIDRIFDLLEWEGDCLVWTGSRHSKGYGHVYEKVDGKWHNRKVHRVVYQHTIGPIPEGRWVLHSCDNPPCCNPEHLWAGTPSQNSQDMWDKGRHKPPTREQALANLGDWIRTTPNTA